MNTLDPTAVTRAIAASSAGAAAGGSGLTGAKPTTMDDIASLAERAGNEARSAATKGAGDIKAARDAAMLDNAFGDFIKNLKKT